MSAEKGKTYMKKRTAIVLAMALVCCLFACSLTGCLLSEDNDSMVTADGSSSEETSAEETSQEESSAEQSSKEESSTENPSSEESSPEESSSKDSSPEESSSEDSSQAETSQQSSAQQSSQTAAAQTSQPTIEEQVLIDYDNITITAVGYDPGGFLSSAGVKLLIENGGEKDVSVGVNAVVVNGYMMGNLFVSDVAAGKKANETLEIYSTDLSAAGIENIGEIVIYFYFYDPDTFDTLYVADPVTIHTSLYPQEDTAANDTGLELLNQDGIRIVGKYIRHDSIMGEEIVLYLENNTGRNITVESDNVSINGFMVETYFFSEVYSGYKAVDEILVSESDLEDNGIDQIKTVELQFHVFDSDTYDTVLDSDPISFSVK